MSLPKSIREASLRSLSLIFGALGGALGIMVMAMMEGWISIPVGAIGGLYFATLLSYSNVARERDEAVRRAVPTGRANPTIVAALLPQVQYAIHSLSQPLAKMKDPQAMERWKEDMRRWERETRDLMVSLGCSASEVSSFWDVTDVDLSRFGTQHINPKISRRKQSIQFKIVALRRITNSYSDWAVFPDTAP